MRLGGCPAQGVCTMTWTSEISGNASSGIRRKDQIPASTSSNVPVNTRKRFCAHQSIQREITLHSSRGVHAELFAGDDLAVLLCKNHDLPRSAAVEFPWTLIESIALFGEWDLRSHRGHAHCWHRGHGKGDRNFSTRDRCTGCIGEPHTERVGALTGSVGFGCEFRFCLWNVHRSCRSCTGRRGNKRPERRLKLAFRVDQ